MKVSLPISPILTVKLVANLPWQCQLSDRKKKDRFLIYDQIPTCGKNLVKISPVNPEIICLKSLF